MKLNLLNIVKAYEFEPIFDGYNVCFSTGLTQLNGDNGSGKTTLLKIIANQVDYEGEIYLDDSLLTCNDCVLVSQEMNLMDNFTVEKNIKYIVSNVTNFWHIIEDFGLTNLLHNKVSTLSGGERRKLSIVIAFMLEPKILLLDEVFTFLDTEAIELIKRAITNYAKDHIVILVDHNLSMTSNIIDLNLSDETQELSEKRLDFTPASIKEKTKHLTGTYKRSIIFNLLSPMFLVFIVLNTLIAISFFVTQLTEQNVAAEYYLKTNCEFYSLNNNEITLTDKYDQFYIRYFGNYEFYGYAYYINDFLEVVEQVGENSEYKNCMIPDFSSFKVGDVLEYGEEEYFISAKFRTNMKDVEKCGDEDLIAYYSNLTSLLFIKTTMIPDYYDGIGLKLEKNQVRELFDKDYLKINTIVPRDIVKILNRDIFLPIMLGITVIFAGVGSFYCLSNARIVKYKRHFLVGYSVDKKRIFWFGFISKFSTFSVIFVSSTIFGVRLFKHCVQHYFDLNLRIPIGLTMLIEILYLVGFITIDSLINRYISHKEINN